MILEEVRLAQLIAVVKQNGFELEGANVFGFSFKSDGFLPPSIFIHPSLEHGDNLTRLSL
jgi:hypothetical protein